MEKEEEIRQEINIDNDRAAGRQTNFLTWEVGRRKGTFVVDFGVPRFECDSQVFVSATEFGPGPHHGGCGHMGAANVQVLNVSPYNGGFKVRINVDNPNPLPIRVHICMRAPS